MNNKNKIWFQTINQVIEQVKEQVKIQIWHQFWVQVGEKVETRIWASLGSSYFKLLNLEKE